MAVSHRNDDPEKDKFLSQTTILLLVGMCVLVVVGAIITNTIMNRSNEQSVDLYWRNPMLTFNASEMNGSTVITAIQSLKDCSVEIVVETKDGFVATYNYLVSEFVPTYTSKGIDEPGYINPNASFSVEGGIPDKDGKVRKVILHQK